MLQSASNLASKIFMGLVEDMECLAKFIDSDECVDLRVPVCPYLGRADDIIIKKREEIIIFWVWRRAILSR